HKATSGDPTCLPPIGQPAPPAPGMGFQQTRNGEIACQVRRVGQVLGSQLLTNSATLFGNLTALTVQLSLISGCCGLGYARFLVLTRTGSTFTSLTLCPSASVTTWTLAPTLRAGSSSPLLLAVPFTSTGVSLAIMKE